MVLDDRKAVPEHHGATDGENDLRQERIKTKYVDDVHGGGVSNSLRRGASPEGHLDAKLRLLTTLRLMQRLAPMILVVVLLIAACGSDGSGDSSAPETPAPAESPTTEAPATTTTTAGPTTTVDPIAAEFGSPEVTGDALPAAVQQGADPAAGLAAPLAVGTDYDGAEVVIGDGGETQAVMFLAHWCPHCQDELPEIVDWLDSTGGVDGVEFILVTTGIDPDRPNFPPSAWIEAEEWAGPVLRDGPESEVFRAYGGSAIPFWAFLYPDGTVATRVLGALGGDAVADILADMAIAP